MLSSGVVGASWAGAHLGLSQVWALALALHVVFFATLGGQGRPRRKAGFTVTLVKTTPISEPQFYLSKAPLPECREENYIRRIKNRYKIIQEHYSRL